MHTCGSPPLQRCPRLKMQFVQHGWLWKPNPWPFVLLNAASNNQINSTALLAHGRLKIECLILVLVSKNEALQGKHSEYNILHQSRNGSRCSTRMRTARRMYFIQRQCSRRLPTRTPAIVVAQPKWTCTGSTRVEEHYRR